MPLDGSITDFTRTDDDVATVLRKAAEIVRERWQQRGIGVDGGPRCAEGAILEASGSTWPFVPKKSALYAEYALLRYLGIDTVTFNDAPGRTAEEVAQAMEAAALLEGGR